MPGIRRILHPTDFSTASRPAFKKALELAKAYRARLLVAHVLSLLPAMPDEYIPPSVWDELQRGQRVTGQRQLDRLVAKAKAAGVRAQSCLLDIGVTHEQIVRLSNAQKIDIIVMGTHGRGGVAKVILGSVASRVLAAARCPVMTVRAR